MTPARSLAVILGAALLIASATSVEAQRPDPIDRTYQPGGELGHGKNKLVYEVVGSEGGHGDSRGLVLAVARRGHERELATELASLETLRRAGVPTVEVLDQGTTSDGQPAFVMRRYEASSKHQPDEFAARWNRRSTREWTEIKRALLASGLESRDLQLVIGRDGSLRVTDPTRVTAPADEAERRQHRKYLEKHPTWHQLDELASASRKRGFRLRRPAGDGDEGRGWLRRLIRRKP